MTASIYADFQPAKVELRKISTTINSPELILSDCSVSARFFTHVKGRKTLTNANRQGEKDTHSPRSLRGKCSRQTHSTKEERGGTLTLCHPERSLNVHQLFELNSLDAPCMACYHTPPIAIKIFIVTVTIATIKFANLIDNRRHLRLLFKRRCLRLYHLVEKGITTYVKSKNCSISHGSSKWNYIPS